MHSYFKQLKKFSARENRPKEIASLLTHDNFANPYPEFKAAEAIRNYGRLFDLLTVSYVFVGIGTRGEGGLKVHYCLRCRGPRTTPLSDTVSKSFMGTDWSRFGMGLYCPNLSSLVCIISSSWKTQLKMTMSLEKSRVSAKWAGVSALYMGLCKRNQTSP